MRRTPKKAGIVALATCAIVAIFAATAFAAPVLQPGVTSAPGMSGVCTDCHVYASAPTTPPVVTPPVVTPPVVTPPVVTPPVVTPPTTTTPSVGKEHDGDDNEKPAAKKAAKAKHHQRKARHHHSND